MRDYLELHKQVQDYLKKTVMAEASYVDQVIPLIRRIDALEGDTILIAIDGNSTAGKSTLATMLQKLYRCNVFHMDDFFLQAEQRTKTRYNEPGGNVDYERFYAEVLEPLRSGAEVQYHPFDCKDMCFKHPVYVKSNRINIIEGVYSQHPYFGEIYDLKVFLSIGIEEQKNRVKARNPRLYDRFMKDWIPMENNYFQFFGIKEQSDFLIRG